MSKSIAIIGGGVSGLTCGVLSAERGFRTTIFADEVGQRTTSGAAAAIWFPYDAEPADRVITWALETYRVLVDLAHDPRNGVSMTELRQFSRTGEIEIPDWAIPLGASVIPSGYAGSAVFRSGFVMTVPLMDTTIYLDYLANRFREAGGAVNANARFERVDTVDPQFDLVINCAGIGARDLVHDFDLEPHRGQVAIVPKIDDLNCAIVCDGPPLMYAIPRANDCVFGGTNEVSNNRDVDTAATSRIVAECSKVLNIDQPRIRAERVGLRPFRKSGVRLERDCLSGGRPVIHNYGHGGSGFTLSWGCAREVVEIARDI